MKNILFVCTGNTCRSVMAAALFRKMAAEAPEFLVSSAGISAMEGFPPSQHTIEVMKDEGLDVSGHRSRRLSRQMLEEADSVFVMEKMHKDLIVSFIPFAKEKISLLTEFMNSAGGGVACMDVPDPIGMTPEFYKNVLSVIRQCVQNIADHLKGPEGSEPAKEG